MWVFKVCPVSTVTVRLKSRQKTILNPKLVILCVDFEEQSPGFVGHDSI